MELEKFQRSDSLCYTSPQTAILILLKNRNFEEFESLFKKNIGKNIDVNYLYEDPDNKTLLDIACSSKKNAKFVKLLLKYGANVNIVNKLLKKAPIHLAVEYSDYDTLKLLVENRNIDINQPDRSGFTALQLAALHGKVDFVELLLKHPAIEVNKTNRKNQTPLHIALSKNNRGVTEILLKNVDVDLDAIRDFDDQTCRELISKKFPDMEMRAVRKSSKSDEGLFSLLYNRNYSAFVEKAKVEKFRLDDDDGENTYLQYACKFGLELFVTALLNLGANPNKTFSANQSTPIMIAAYQGYHNIVRSLVDTGNIVYDPVDGNNALHAVLNGVVTCHRDLGSVGELGTGGEQNFYKCLEYLLNNVPCQELDLNLPDAKGNTVLHYAFRANDPDIISFLLKKGAYIGHKNFNNEMPVKFMNAETLERYLDDSITTNGNLLGEEDYEVVFKYHLLAPPKQYLPKNRKMGYSAESGLADEYEVVSETEPLVAMSEVSELRPLLKHPLITTFLNLKWYTIRKYFWVNLVFYLTFWALLTFYILYVYGPVTSIVANHNGTDPVDVDALEESRKNGSVLWYLTLVFSSILFLREFFQFSISAVRYITSPENWIEVALIVTAYVILLCDATTSDSRSQLSAVAIFLSWMELVLLIGRHPLVSTYVEMFKVVTWNFLKFLAWYSVLILAFALSFYLLFKDRRDSDVLLFKDPALAIFKSTIMSTGEYDASNIPFGNQVGTSHVMFVLFVFLVSIVLFNLLNGLAVSDTQAIRMDAELVGIICRAKLIAYIERMAISDPFPYLNLLDKMTCFCCCVPIKRQSETRRKHLGVFYNSINLFPNQFPDREVRVLVNQENRVVKNNVKVSRVPEDGLTNCYGLQEWRIQNSIIKAAKHILSLRASEARAADPHEVTQAINNLQEVYENRLITLENTSKRAEDRLRILEESSRRTEQKLSEIMKLLKEKTHF